MIDVIDLSVQFSGDNLFENVNLRINREDKIAMVGANGTGKSTFLKIIAGLVSSETGNVAMPKGTKIGYLPQEIIEKKGRSLFGEIKSSLVEINELEQKELELTSKLNSPQLSENEKELLTLELGEVHHRKDEVNYYSVDSEIEKVLTGLGFENSDFNRLTDEFSGGWQMRIELAKILLSNNDIILLDEPTNHLDIDSLEWLITFLLQFNGAIVVVSHDRYFVNKITNKTLEIFNRKISFYKGKYDDYLNFKLERDNQLQAELKNQQQKIKETEKFIERFRSKATKAKQVQSRVKQLEKIERIEIDNSETKMRLKFPEPPRSGVIPVELKSVTKTYEHTIFSNLDLKIERGEKIAFLGPNGAGKTTLSTIIAGKLEATEGEVVIGHNTQVSYYAQEVANNLDISKSVLETLADSSPDYTEGQLRTVLGSFLFSNNDVYKKVKVLSGGEKSRVALAKIMLQKANVIVLDEPTNHLDITSKEILQNALVEFTGTLIIVSHDIEFIRPIVNKVIEIRKSGIKYYYGGIDYYFEKRESELNDSQSAKNNVKADTQISKKELKRLEAELRKEKYAATKGISSKIEKLEESIMLLEDKKLELEDKLGDETIYSNPELLKETNISYEATKKEIAQSEEEWADLSEKLETLENQFSEKLNSLNQ